MQFFTKTKLETLKIKENLYLTRWSISKIVYSIVMRGKNTSSVFISEKNMNKVQLTLEQHGD